MEKRFTGVVFVIAAMLVMRVCEARPATDYEPIKFSLHTGKDAEFHSTERPLAEEINSRLKDGAEWLYRMMDAIRIGRGRLVNSVAVARNVIAERLEELMSETQNNVAGAIGAANDIISRGRSTIQSYEKAPLAQFLPPKTRETVRLETEAGQGFFERKKTNPLSSLLENIVKPTPIVDGIKEEEKYGNNGDRFIGVGRALVNGFEGLSNFLNAIVDFPVNAAKKTSRNITEALNQIGSKLIGLQ